MSNPILAAADDLRQKLAEKVEDIKALPEMLEVLKLHQALNALEDVLEAQPTTLSELFGLDTGSSTPIRPDEFYGLSALDAAKKYLKKRGRARPLKEVVEAIKAGGGASTSEEDLRLSLSRSTYEVAKVGEDVYGLVEFYPNLRRGKKKKADETPSTTMTPDPADSGNGNTDQGETK